MNTYIFASQASVCLLSSLPLLIKFECHCCPTVDMSYRLFLMAANESFSIEKIMSLFVYKIPQILNTMMVFKEEFTVGRFKYN